MFSRRAVRLFLLLFVFIPNGTASAANGEIRFVPWSDFEVCEGSVDDKLAPFDTDRCETTDLDPQGRVVWVRGTVSLTQTTGSNGEPLSLFLSGKMSSDVYLNGTFIGSNGRVGEDRTAEKPGLMDAEFFPDQRLFRIGENEIIFRASSHRGYLKLARPVHAVGIAPAGFGHEASIRYMSVTLMTLGGLLLGCIYFGVLGAISKERRSSVLLSAICAAAAAQLLSEASRSLFDYPYPVHDLRLLAIAFFSWTFGVLTTLHVLLTFKQAGSYKIVAVLAAATALIMFSIPSFDLKALSGLIVPLVSALGFTCWWAYKGQPRALAYALSLLGFLSAISLLGSVFLDTAFFLLVSAFVAFLFIDQANAFEAETKQRASERERANRLEQALAEASERESTGYFNIRSSGKVERVATNQIVRCRSADGYTEVVMADGRALLHNGSLGDLEQTLPGTFLRVHRSHLVNVTFIASLIRETSGVGTLELTTDDTVPVSRRVLPKVKQALN